MQTETRPYRQAFSCVLLALSWNLRTVRLLLLQFQLPRWSQACHRVQTSTSSEPNGSEHKTAGA